MYGKTKRIWIVTGGQSGIDRSAMDIALELKLPLRGWCPSGRIAEDGTISVVYPLQETPSPDVAERTEWNARDSDATLIIHTKEMAKDGTSLTFEVAKKYNKNILEIFLEDSEVDVARFWKWIDENNINILNVAGPRESHKPGYVYSRGKEILFQLLKNSVL